MSATKADVRPVSSRVCGASGALCSTFDGGAAGGDTTAVAISFVPHPHSWREFVRVSLRSDGLPPAAETSLASKVRRDTLGRQPAPIAPLQTGALGAPKGGASPNR